MPSTPARKRCNKKRRRELSKKRRQFIKKKVTECAVFNNDCYGCRTAPPAANVDSKGKAYWYRPCKFDEEKKACKNVVDTKNWKIAENLVPLAVRRINNRGFQGSNGKSFDNDKNSLKKAKTCLTDEILKCLDKLAKEEEKTFEHLKNVSSITPKTASKVAAVEKKTVETIQPFTRKEPLGNEPWGKVRKTQETQDGKVRKPQETRGGSGSTTISEPEIDPATNSETISGEKQARGGSGSATTSESESYDYANWITATKSETTSEEKQKTQDERDSSTAKGRPETKDWIELALENFVKKYDDTDKNDIKHKLKPIKKCMSEKSRPDMTDLKKINLILECFKIDEDLFGILGSRYVRHMIKGEDFKYKKGEKTRLINYIIKKELDLKKRLNIEKSLIPDVDRGIYDKFLKTGDGKIKQKKDFTSTTLRKALEEKNQEKKTRQEHATFFELLNKRRKKLYKEAKEANTTKTKRTKTTKQRSLDTLLNGINKNFWENFSIKSEITNKKIEKFYKNKFTQNELTLLRKYAEGKWDARRKIKDGESELKKLQKDFGVKEKEKLEEATFIKFKDRPLLTKETIDNITANNNPGEEYEDRKGAPDNTTYFINDMISKGYNFNDFKNDIDLISGIDDGKYNKAKIKTMFSTSKSAKEKVTTRAERTDVDNRLDIFQKTINEWQEDERDSIGTDILNELGEKLRNKQDTDLSVIQYLSSQVALLNQQTTTNKYKFLNKLYGKLQEKFKKNSKEGSPKVDEANAKEKTNMMNSFLGI